MHASVPRKQRKKQPERKAMVDAVWNSLTMNYIQLRRKALDDSISAKFRDGQNQSRMLAGRPVGTTPQRETQGDTGYKGGVCLVKPIKVQICALS